MSSESLLEAVVFLTKIIAMDYDESIVAKHDFALL